MNTNISQQIFRIRFLLALPLIIFLASPSHAQFGGLFGGKSSSQDANEQADQAMYKPVNYANQSKKGPNLVVLPGEVKSNNATFTERYFPNSIADFAELELSKANFGVLERSDLGSLLNEVELAYNLGDVQAAQRTMGRGKLKSTKWILKFDILKAEPVAKASKGFSGATAGALIGILGGGGTGTAVAGTAAGSYEAGDTAGVWIVGMRYKIINAETTEQMAMGYFEDKMEVGTASGSFLGFSQEQEGGVTLNTMVQRLVQQSVAEIDSNYK